MPHDYFDEAMARRYDRVYADLAAQAVVGPAVDFIASLADGGPVLELGVGTGRLALPLAERGLEVHGIDLSPAMIRHLEAKPGAERVAVVVGDFATTRVDRSFRLVYLVRNTIMNLTTQDEQVQCFANAASHLLPGGCFVIEVIVPALRSLPPGQSTHVFESTPRHLGFDEFDLVTQTEISHHHWFDGDAVERFSAPFRYVWPSELDLMARLAGLGLRERWADWERRPFTSESTSHISVWELPDE